MWVFLCAAAALIFLIQYHLNLQKKLKNYPPGPRRLPLIGSILSVPGELIHLHMEKWSGVYGNVVGLLAGHKTIVAVSGADDVLALLKHEHCQARPDDFFTRHRSKDHQRMGIFGTDGQFWTNQRRFTMRELRDLGFGKSSLEGVVLDELSATLKQMEETGPLVQPNDLFNVPVLNVLWWLVSGKPFARDDVAFERLTNVMAQLMRNKRGAVAPFNVWPFLRFIAPEWSGYNEAFKPAFELIDFLKNEVKSQTDSDDCGHSYMSVYIREAIAKGKEGFSVESLVLNCFDIFLAGGESTANTLSFALMYLCMYPEVQDKVHAELDAQVGRGKLPGLNDRPKLPYLEAVMSEVMRVNPIAPITPPHLTSADIEFNGYTIPKNTTLILSLYSVQNDKKYWGDPENFRPERFLDAEGRYVRNPLLVPFGLGKRVCIGESLVQQTLYLFLAGLLSRFHFSLPAGHPKLSTIPVPGFTVTPQPYETLAVRRA